MQTICCVHATLFTASVGLRSQDRQSPCHHPACAGSRRVVRALEVTSVGVHCRQMPVWIVVIRWKTNPARRPVFIHRDVYRCYTGAPMRKWLAVILLVFIPLQASWAAVASYCQHETGVAAKHFGHHDHQHKAADGKGAATDPAQIGSSDPDCAYCHAGCSPALPGEVACSSPIARSSMDAADYRARLAPPPFEHLERPQWRVLA